MTLELLKQKIELKEEIPGPVIFVFKDTDFIATQYVHAFSNYMNLDICSLESLSDISNTYGVFSDYTDVIYLFRTDDISTLKTSDINNTKHLFIITSNGKITDKSLSEYIINLPKIEPWQIKDYIDTNAPKLLNEDPSFPERCGLDMYVIENEVAKFSIFTSQSAALVPKIFSQSDAEGCLRYLNKYSVYDIIKALLKKDTESLGRILEYDTSKIFRDPEGKENYFGFITLLYNSVKDIINVTIGVNTTPISTGMQPGKFWAIKNAYENVWSKRQLEKILLFLTAVDKDIRSGKLPMNNNLFYYIVVTILETED